MDIRQLHYFLKVAQLGSMTAAAADLGIAQPTLTKSMRLLEEQLGTPLLHRLPRGVELTAAGARLAHHAKAVEVQLADAEREIGQLRDGASGEVVIGAGPAWLRRHLPEAVATALSDHPMLRFRIIGGFEVALLRELRAGSLDMVLAELPTGPQADLDMTPLVADRLVVLARAGHPLAGRRCEPRDLLDFPWVMSPAGTGARRRLDALFLARNLAVPDVQVETSSMTFLLRVLHQTDLLNFAVETTLAAPDGKGLAVLDVPALAAEREAGLIKRRGTDLSPAAQSLVTAVSAICARNPRN